MMHKTITIFSPKVNATYTQLYHEMQALSDVLSATEERLNNITIFMSEMGTGLEKFDETNQNISAFFAVIQSLNSQVVKSNGTIVKNQIEVMALHASTVYLQNSTAMGNEALEFALNKSNLSIELVQMTQSVATEISSVNTMLSLTEKRVDDFESGLVEETFDMDELVEELEMLNQVLANFNVQLMSISMLSEMLENSTTSVREEAETVQNSIENFKVFTHS